jgi:hypothetical protein
MDSRFIYCRLADFDKGMYTTVCCRNDPQKLIMIIIIIIIIRRSRVVGIATRLRAGRSGVRITVGAKDIFSRTSKPALRPTQPLV